MGFKTFARLHPVFINNTKLLKALMLSVVLLAEGKGMAAIQPAQFRMTTILTGS